MPRLRRPAHPVALLGVLVVAVLVLVALVVVRSNDGPELRIERGAPAKGFPLRGDLAGDQGTLEAAARKWIDRDRRDDRDVFGSDDERVEVTALWAGRVGDERRVILAADRTAALLGTDGRIDGKPFWRLFGTTQVIDEQDPRIVPFDGGVLVAAAAKPTFRSAQVGAAEATAVDGLWRPGSRSPSADLPDGVLVLPDGLRPTTATADRVPAVVVTGRGTLVRGVERPLARTLASGTPGEAPPALQRFVAAVRAVADQDGGRVAAFAPPRVRIVGESVLPRVGATMVVATTGQWDRGRARLSAAVGGTGVANGPRPSGIVLPTASENGGLDADGGPAAGAAYVQRRTDAEDPVPVLLLAGEDPVARFEILDGAARRVVDGPVAAVRATWRRIAAGGASQKRDVVIVGRTQAGAVVPLGPVAGSVTAVGERP